MVNKRKLENDQDVSQRSVKPFASGDSRTHSKGNEASSLDHEASSLDRLADLNSLLDLSSLTSKVDISSRFAGIAGMLLNHIVLRLHAPAADDDTASISDYEILELEFYLYKSGCHEDPFTHGTEEQRKSGRWYFHRAPRRNGSVDPTSSKARTPTAAGGYRGGTRKGLDLTFGGPVDGGTTSRFFTTTKTEPAPEEGSRRGGILLRTLRRKADRKLFSGPSLLVDELLRASGASNIAELVNDIWNEDVHAFGTDAKDQGPSLRLHAMESKNDIKKVYSSPRIGLDLSNPVVPVPTGTLYKPTLDHPRTDFISRRYRYFVQPSLLTSNGRGHTFLGVYEDLLDEGLGEGELTRRLADVTGLKHPTAMKYLDEYRAGKGASLRQFVGAQGKGTGSSPIPFLRMLGCLDHLQSDSQTGSQ